MPVPNKSLTDTKKTPQNIYNNSYDIDFNVLAFEILGYDVTNGVLRRIKVGTDGKLQTA